MARHRSHAGGEPAASALGHGPKQTFQKVARVGRSTDRDAGVRGPTPHPFFRLMTALNGLASSR